MTDVSVRPVTVNMLRAAAERFKARTGAWPEECVMTPGVSRAILTSLGWPQTGTTHGCQFNPAAEPSVLIRCVVMPEESDGDEYCYLRREGYAAAQWLDVWIEDLSQCWVPDVARAWQASREEYATRTEE